ncbi:zinc finger MYM-type protein 1-like [Salvia splendens]|uniref:zinc finger MYM-type protein 1-like n=1 Tax=Salvia splendens TaxID=180675 RepID=UPI001C274097|nr:zinc finger MYM-type protein 1-like [Salvia splendens]
MALVIRYVNNNGEIVERFLALVHVTDTTAKSLKEGIDSVFAKHVLSLSRLRGQGYDGASNMRGEYNGLKTLILNENISTKYIHCFAHQLQLVVVNVTKQHGAISDFFTIVTMIVNTCGTSCKRRDKLRQAEHEKIVKSLESEEIKSGRGLNQEMSLRRPGDTRWGSHFTTLLRLKGMWSSIIEMLEHVYEDGTNLDNRGISKTLSMRLGSYDFVYILHLMVELLGSTNDLSKVLQLWDQNIVQAISLIDTTKRNLQDFRENGWNQFLRQVEEFCVTNYIDVINMDDTVKFGVRMKRGERVTNYHHYKVEVYCQVLDLVIQEMENRFPETNTELLICMNCLSPRTPLLASISTSCDIVDKVEFSNIEDLGNLAKILVATTRDKAFPLVYRLIELTLILPVATASVERVFSSMKFIKTDLRNRMEDGWMNDILVVYTEREIFNKIENEAILRRFQEMASRRKQLSSRAS